MSRVKGKTVITSIYLDKVYGIDYYVHMAKYKQAKLPKDSVKINVHIGGDLWIWAKTVAKEMKISTSELIRRAIETYLNIHTIGK